MTSKIKEEYSEITGLPPSFFLLNQKNYINNLKLRFPQLNQNSIIALQGGCAQDKYDTDVDYYYFDQESNFYYLTGVRTPGLKAIIDIKTGNTTLYYSPFPNEYKIWMKVPTIEDIEEKYGIPTRDMNSFESDIGTRNPEYIYVIDGINENSGTPVLTCELNFKGELSYLNDRISHNKYIYMVLCDTRAVKNEEEIKLLKYIADISNEAHIELIKYCKVGLNERDMENFFLQYLRDKHYTRFYAYNCICATGANGATLHYDLNNQDLKENDLFLTDMGIRFCGYVSDITTTFPVNGKFTDQQKQIYDIVLKSNQEVIKSMKPGITRYIDMDILGKKIILQGLFEIGILTDSDIDKMYDDRVWFYFMPHSIGHLVGLDVHDVGTKVSYKSLRLIEKGNFITVEPGIYFIDFLMDQIENDPNLSKYVNKEVLETFRGFGGVRIEDDVMVYDTKVESFQKDIPRTTEEIETFMKNNKYN